jgi:subtilisin family serine protease/chitodextrinase
MAHRTFVAAIALLGFAVPALAQYTVRVPIQIGPEFIGWVPDRFVAELTPTARAVLHVSRGPGGLPSVDVPSLQHLLENHRVQRFEPEFAAARPEPPGSRAPDLTGYYEVQLGAGVDLDAAVAAFAADPNVDHVEKIGIHAVYATPNDPYFQGSPSPTFPYDQWHYWNVHGIDADQAWDSETGDPSVVVGIVDTGIRYFHTDLGGSSPQWGPANPFAGGNIFINAGETPGNGVDDDGNGFVDDTIGWDFITAAGGGGVTCLDQDCSGADNDPDDGVGHGTHVAGTVAAITNNNNSVAGIAGGFANGTSGGAGNGVRVLPLRIGYLARIQGITTGLVQMDWAAQAFAYASNLKDHGVNIVALNCSWGSSNSGGFDAAVNNALAHDIMVVHAAGNSNSTVADFLGNKAGVLNVAATDSLGNGASFTNSGPWVAVAAPGVTILSTYRNPSDADPTHQYIAVLDGTSMAAPHICGIAALLESCNPALTGPQKFTLITGHTTPYTDARNLGSGIANARLALIAAGCSACNVAAAFSAAPPSGCAPLAVTFTDQSVGTGISGWSWTFGDGGTSALQNPTHSYLAAGTYDVRLIVTNGSCADTTITAAAVSVSAKPHAAFAAAPTSGTVPLQVTFTDQSTGGPTGWSWSFGDGVTSNQQSPVHTYVAAGTYNVQLVAANACGPDTLLQAGLVTASPPTAVELDPRMRVTTSWALPNPVTLETQILFHLVRADGVELVVYDVAGHPVRHLARQRFDSGLHQVGFDGTDDGGRRLASGVYFYRFVTPDRVETRKLILSR